MTITTAQPTKLQIGISMNNKVVKIGLITLATVGIMTVSVIFFTKKLGKKLPPTVKSADLTPEAKTILSEAYKYVGIDEVGDNAGFSDKDFESQMKQIGWVSKEPYCAAFVRLVLLNVSSGRAKQFFTATFTKHSATTYNLVKSAVAKKSEYVEIISKPESGCIIIYDGHTEICESNIDGKQVNVISANTYFTDKSGQGIARKVRTPESGIKNGDKVEKFLGYVRIKKLS